jgi:hypothetical protein
VSATKDAPPPTLAETPPAEQLATRPRPETVTVTWSVDAAPWPTSSVRKTALCRETADGWVLQHVRTVTVSQRADSGCQIDTKLVLEDLPGYVRAKLPDDVKEVTGGA